MEELKQNLEYKELCDEEKDLVKELLKGEFALILLK